MRVTNWVIRFVPWDVRFKRRKQKQQTPKRTSKRGVMQQVWSVLWVCSHHVGLLARSKTGIHL
jgi:hypothetical protein